MKLSTKGRYATRAILELAMREGDDPIQLRGVAEAQNVSAKYLERLFQMLKQAGVLKSIRGVHGGYLLARNPNDITIQQIVEAVEGPISIVDCVAQPVDCARSLDCVSRTLWARTNKLIVDYLGAVTLSDLIKEASSANLETQRGYHLENRCLSDLVIEVGETTKHL